MKSSFLGALVWLSIAACAVFAQTTVFTYQGKLTDAGQPANNNYDLQFKLFDALAGGVQQGGTLVRTPVPVSAGNFTVTLDFGAAVFGGADRYLEIGVRPANSAIAYTVLAPRQPINSTPYAIRSMNSTQLGGVDASQYVTTSTVGNAFIKNDTTQQIGANLNISGNGLFGGNVGIGTTSPLSKLTVQGSGYGLTHTSGAVTLGTFITTAAGGSGWLGTKSNHPLSFFTNDGLPQMTLDISGNVGIGTAAPTTKLYVLSSTAGLSAVYGESATGRGVWGKSISSRGVYGESTSLEGVYGISSSGTGVSGASTSGSGVYGQTAVSSPTAGGVYGKGLGNDSLGVIGESNNGNNAVGVYGVTSSPNGFGVFARNNAAGGRAFYADGNAAQSRDKGGLVKAMVYVLENGNISRCYNSQLADGGASLPPSGNTGCGFTSSRGCADQFCYTSIDFGFKVDDRFWAATIEGGGVPHVNRGINAKSVTSVPNLISVTTFKTGEELASDFFSPFMLIVY
jgi:hypothetical protein